MAILTVYTKLLDQTLDGARIIDMGSAKTCQCFVLPRNRVDDIEIYNYIPKQFVFYILLGQDNKGKPMAYIGQTSDFSKSVVDDAQTMGFWDRALAFSSKGAELTANDVLYLEYIGRQKADDANNYLIVKERAVSEPTMSEERKNDMAIFYEDVIFLTRFYGCSVFDETIAVEENYEVLYINMPNKYINATVHYYPNENKYILKKGSTIASYGGVSCPSGASIIRDQIKKDSSISMDNGSRVLMLCDYNITGDSHLPYIPACVITGTSTHGKTLFNIKHKMTFKKKSK